MGRGESRVGKTVWEKRGIMRRFGLAWVGVLTAWVLLGSTASWAQGNGAFLCSAGSRDGQTCLSFSDCPGGVCVIAQGVCSNGDPCVCPGGGRCNAAPACDIDASFGTCSGGVMSGVCCAVGFNCPTGDSCAATHRICLNGPFRGYPCTTNAMCEGGTCGSNGFFCEGGDADAYPCADSNDCPGGFCETAFAQPTATPNTPGATQPPRTPTPTFPGITPGVTNTPRPFPTLSPGIVPTATAIGTVAPTPTFTPVVGTLLLTTAPAFIGASKILVEIEDADLSTFPVQGIVDIGGSEFDFTRRRSSRALDLKLVEGLPFALPAGSVVRVVEYVHTPGPIRHEDRAVDESCAIRPAQAGDRGPLWLVALGLLGVVLRFRRA